MTQICLVCGTLGLFGKEYIQNVFDDENTSCDRKLSETICEIIDKELDEESVHSKVLCKDCHDMCSNYDMYRNNMSILKSKLSEQYYETQEKITKFASATDIETCKEHKKVTKGKFVVPASKLQPLPADFQLNLGKIAALTTQTQAQKPLLNLKVTIGNSVLTQSLASSTVKVMTPGPTNPKGKGVVAEWSVSSLPAEIFNEAGDEHLDVELGDDCNTVPVTKEEPIVIDASNVKTEDSDGTNYINAENVEWLLEGQEQEGDQPHTIVLDSNNSILQMMSGQKLVYEAGEISLLMDDHDDENDDGQDSNDEESQIELQVSGDEETANAIIAAAQEQGGAFIKVESGEMYRVKSVKSQPAPGQDTAAQLVRRDGAAYTCLVCPHAEGSAGKSFASEAAEMMEHMKSAHSAKVYICATCGVIMRNRSEYSTHMATHGTKSDPTVPKARSYDCAVCKKSYNSRTLLQEHMNLHTGKRPYECHICDKAFASKYTRQAHLKTHQARPRPFKCSTCGKSFLSQQNLTQHEKTHLGIKSFVCSICHKAFGTQHSLEVHGVVHSGQKSHVCSVCDKAFARRAELVDHARIHTGERPFACDTCGARFSQRSNLHSHRRATHLDDKRHACPDCPKRFKRRRLLQYHIKAAHTGERPLVCGVCHTTFVYPEHYKKHIRIHSGERPYFCEICGKAFNSRDNRNTHRFVHSDKKPYECLACGASYMRKRMLVAHMNANGHLAESIVVNQPRVTRVNENIFLDERREVKATDDSDDDSTKVSEDDDDDNDHSESKLFALAEDTAIANPQENAIITVSAESIDPQVTNGNGSILQFIQVKMADGKDGWVALND